MIRRPPRATLDRSSAASDVYKRQVLSGIQTAIDKAEKNYKGLVIANEGPNFSAGANVGMIFMLAIDQEYDCLLYTSPSPRDRTRSRMPSSA